MSFLDAIILGVLQGLTEFLPVSSSGHLVLAQEIMDIERSGVSFEITVHLATLLAVLVYFRSSINRLLISIFDKRMQDERRIIGYILIATVPAVIAGVLFNDFFESAFSSPVMTSIMLMATGLILLSTRFTGKGQKRVSFPIAVMIGISQAAAIMPGISRSGTTIAAGMAVGVKPSKAAEFSFLLSIPVIAGAAVFKWREFLNLDTELVGHYLVGALFAFVSALFAVHLVLESIRRGKFQYFAYYCFAAGAVGLYLFL